MVFFIASFTMGGLNFVTTILNLRTKGLSLMRMPLTMWSMFLVAILGLLAFPALTAASLMLLFDRHFGTSFFLPAGIVVSGVALVEPDGTPLHQGGLAAPLAAPLLVPRPSRGLHPDAACAGLHLRHHRHLLPQADLRLQDHGRRPWSRSAASASWSGATTCS